MQTKTIRYMQKLKKDVDKDVNKDIEIYTKAKQGCRQRQ